MTTKNKQTAKPSRQLTCGLKVRNLAPITVSVQYRERYEGVEFGNIIHLDKLDAPVSKEFGTGATLWAKAHRSDASKIVVDELGNHTWSATYTLAEFAKLFAPVNPDHVFI
jgi:hypothetical protein